MTVSSRNWNWIVKWLDIHPVTDTTNEQKLSISSGNETCSHVQHKSLRCTKYTEKPFRLSAFSIMTWGLCCSSYLISRQKSWSATNLSSSTWNTSHVWHNHTMNLVRDSTAEHTQVSYKTIIITTFSANHNWLLLAQNIGRKENFATASNRYTSYKNVCTAEMRTMSLTW